MMKLWNKYLLKPGEGTARSEIDSTALNHSTAMGGYEVDSANYATKEAFFKQFTHRRFAAYEQFLPRHLVGENIFSIASGRCNNEMQLIEQGFDVTCSDIEVPPCYEETVRLFGDFEYLPLDILQTPPPRQFDSVMSLSLIYLFDEAQLDIFFRNVAQGLRAKGRFVLDSAGPLLTFMSYLYSEYLLSAEARLYVAYHNWKYPNDKYRLSIKHHGYKRSSKEVVTSAQNNGLTLLATECADIKTELERSYYFYPRMKDTPFLSGLFSQLGNGMPYVNLFVFEKQ